MALITLSGCAEPGTEWINAPAQSPELKVGDSLAAITIAQDICRPVIEKLTGRQRQDFFEHQQKSGWRAMLSSGVWKAGVAPMTKHPDCFEMSVEIDARTGRPSTCLQCVIVG
jgi:hypothetical protein